MRSYQFVKGGRNSKVPVSPCLLVPKNDPILTVLE